MANTLWRVVAGSDEIRVSCWNKCNASQKLRSERLLLLEVFGFFLFIMNLFGSETRRKL